MNAQTAKDHPHRTHLPTAWLALAVGPFFLGTALAGQLTYVPVNPSFGGNPLNGPYLLQSAQAQKSYPYPMDDLGLDGSGDYKILNGGNYPIIQVGNSVYIYDSAKGQWVPFDPDHLPADTPTSADAGSPTAPAPTTPSPSAASIDSGVLR